jgi:hypothetical protein
MLTFYLTPFLFSLSPSNFLESAPSPTTLPLPQILPQEVAAELAETIASDFMVPKNAKHVFKKGGKNTIAAGRHNVLLEFKIESASFILSSHSTTLTHLEEL